MLANFVGIFPERSNNFHFFDISMLITYFAQVKVRKFKFQVKFVSSNKFEVLVQAQRNPFLQPSGTVQAGRLVPSGAVMHHRPTFACRFYVNYRKLYPVFLLRSKIVSKVYSSSSYNRLRAKPVGHRAS